MLYGDGKRAADDRIRDMYTLPADAPEDTRTPEQRAPVCQASIVPNIDTGLLEQVFCVT